MEYEVTTRHNALEHMLLDVNAEPMDLPLSLLEDITKCFSDDQQIGSGGFAVVYKGILENGIVAVKRLSRTFDIHENKFHKEVECLMKARHKNIVRFLGYCSDTQGKIVDYEGKLVMADVRNWLLCFEYVPNGSLEKYITDASCGLQWRERYQIIKGICRGLCHLHEKCILHLDLKPANILLDDHMVPKIADFGLSRCLDKEQTRVFTSHLCGSQGYLAPEFYCGQIAFASDIYSLGVIIVEVLTGKKGYSEDENVVESWMDRLETSDEKNIHLEQVRVCTKIGMQCMNVDPKKRPLASHIMHMLDKTESAISSSSHDSSSSLTHMVWVRERSTDWWDRLNDPLCPDVEFRYAFHMSRFTFNLLCDDLSDVVAKEDNAIPVHQRVAVCLWRLATGEPLREVSRRFGLGISTCHDIVLRVCAAITAVLLPQAVIWSLEPPTDDRFQVIGAVCVDHVPISPPKENTAEYYNHRLSMRNNEASYSISVQAVVNADGTFMDVCIGLPGSLSDADVLKRSALHSSCEAGMLGKGRLVGSVSYQLTDWMLVPYRHQNLTWAQHSFNERVAAMQVAARVAFQRLKARWRFVQRCHEPLLPDLHDVIGACISLHNLCERSGEELYTDLQSEPYHGEDDMLIALKERDRIAHDLLRTVTYF
uniref:Uncharacterized protein n=1 Tax=Avena sativa TaxID=4498 RepID=A0ACD5YB52_AVESA